MECKEVVCTNEHEEPKEGCLFQWAHRGRSVAEARDHLRQGKLRTGQR